MTRSFPNNAKQWMIAALLIGLGVPVQAQFSPNFKAPAEKARVSAPMAFEVISIRPKASFSQGLPEVGPTSDGWRMVDNGLSFVILHAYVPTSGANFYTGNQIQGLPDWTQHESYEIHAKVGEANLADWQNSAKQPAMLQAMLQSMLVDRCKMAVHRETKEVTVLALEQGKGKPKYVQSIPGEHHPNGNPLPGGGVAAPEDGGKVTHLYGVRMSSFASLLSGIAKQPVQDKTGLTGEYDIVIPNIAMLRAMAAQQNGDATSEPEQTVFSVVQDLGMKLESTKGTVETLVIDHIERPTEN